MIKYTNSSLPIVERVEDLIAQMTLEEKCAQLTQFFGRNAYKLVDNKAMLISEYKEKLSGNGIGLLYGVQRADAVAGVTVDNNLTIPQAVELVNEIQRCNIENTRLGIPMLFAEECSHGLMAYGATVYPVPLCVSATWNDELYGEMCHAIAVEARSRGVVITYSPVLESTRDLRWGRTEETYGEDVYLCTRMGLKAIKKLEGTDISSDSSIVAAIKHFVVHGVPEGGINVAYTSVGERQLHEVWLEPFKRAIEAGARSLITSYNEVDGTPICASKALIKDLVKEKWGFKGFIFSDLGAVELLKDVYKIAEDYREATKLSFEAGIDIDMLGVSYNKYLVELVNDGEIAIEEINESVSRILMLKFQLGLFENPYVDVEKAILRSRSKEYVDIACQIAREGIVLLKNENSILPLSKEISKISVIGPNADNVYNQLGDYTAYQQRENITTVLDGIKNRACCSVEYAKGCSVREIDKSGFSEAISAAQNSDVIIAVMGGSSSRFSSEDCVDMTTGQAKIVDGSQSDMECGEGVDRCMLELLGVQTELLMELKKLGKPLVVVYIAGRPISEPWVEENADAIVFASYPGEQGGNAVADIVFGNYNPSGKLTVSIPKHVGQLPLYYCRRPSIKLRYGYVEMDAEARYPFGFGLSYTSFEYSNLEITVNGKGSNAVVTAKLNITNTGKYYGEEVVQLYLNKDFSSVTRPDILLKGFKKVGLDVDETKNIELELGYHELKVLGANMDWVVEAGKYNILIGSSSKDIRLRGTFEIII